MPQRFFEEIKNWAEGVHTTTAPDLLPEGASPRARNTLLTGQDSALVESRRGAALLNSTPISGSPRLWGFQFKKADGSKYNLLVSDTGRLDKLNSDTTTSVINALAFTAGSHPPVFAVANDLCFIVNDVDQKKTDGTSLYEFGIARPSAPSASATSGGGMLVGDWDVAITYYNSNTGHESSLSDSATATLFSGSQKLTVSWSAPADTQVTHVRVYVRRREAGATFYCAVAGATPAADTTALGYTPSTTSAVLDITTTQYSAFTTAAPSTTENEPPPTGTQGPCWHASRLFVHDKGNLYFSKVKNNRPYPESFDPDNRQPVNPDDGDEIVALRAYRERLFIFKKFALYALTGTDPNSWSVDLVARGFGAASPQAIIEAPDGNLYWWTNSDLGLAAFDGEGMPAAVGQQLMAPTVSSETLAQTNFSGVCASVDEARQVLLFAVPSLGSSRNDLLIPFHYKLRRFCAEFWNPFDINSLWTVTTDDATQAVYVGGYAGQAFRWWGANNDGVPATSTMSGSVSSATSTTLNDIDATFITTGGKLVDRYVYVLNTDRTYVQRRRITDNTATSLTLATAFDVVPNDTYTYVIGGIDFQIDTPWMNGPSVFLKKRFEFFFTEAETDDVAVSLDIDFFTSKQLVDPVKTKSISLSGTGGLYDATTSVYDTTTFANTGVSFSKLRCGFTGRAWRARLRTVLNNQHVTLRKVAMQGIPMSIRA